MMHKCKFLKDISMKEVCRLCLRANQNDVTHLFHNNINENECQQIRLQIADLCSIIILQNDDLPKFICSKCKLKLQDAYEFVSLCKTSNDTLHEYYKKNKYSQDKFILLNEKNQKQSKEKNHKNTGESLRSTKKSVSIHVAAPLNPTTYTPILTQSTFVTTKKITKPNSKNIDDSSFSLNIEETEIKHCNELPSNNEKQYLCDVCSKTFASMSGLRFHLKSHYGSKPYTCQYCDKSFAIPSYKKRHEKTHTGDKLFICHICSTAFASSNGLKYHLRTHTGETNYHCGICDKSFARYKYLKEHIFTHTGEKPFICKLCNSAYANSGSLFVHEKKCKLRHTFNRKNVVENTAVII